ncbi:hypothetical protein BDV26DRAFT_195685 [Aspergillus bertholletiae]|uniref:Uncharacterized protein n=1 Tax=Aspergillus bertholletiae TaxID=1226010 RepID=A0A5N7BMA9_9EURO|nr:hypothetical protein BDV26DRAFT_195685 [Aspergillus bertholletiae]
MISHMLVVGRYQPSALVFCMSLCFMNSMKRTVLIAIYPLHSLIIPQEYLPDILYLSRMEVSFHIMSYIYYSRRSIPKFHTQRTKKRSEKGLMVKATEYIHQSPTPPTRSKLRRMKDSKNKHDTANQVTAKLDRQASKSFISPSQGPITPMQS